jgi:hypothetical protein
MRERIREISLEEKEKKSSASDFEPSEYFIFFIFFQMFFDYEASTNVFFSLSRAKRAQEH